MPGLKLNIARGLISGLLFLFFSSCSTWAEKPKVFASIQPLALLVKDIAGELVTIEVLVKGSSSPHDFSLTISQALKLNEADLFVWVGPEFETFLSAGALPSQHVSISSLVEKIDGDDKHLWLNTSHIALLAMAVAENLKHVLPEAENTIDANLNDFLISLQQSKANSMQALAPYLGLPFAVHHDGYGAFVDEFKLFQTISLTTVPHERLSARRLRSIGEGMSKAYCLLAEKGEEHEAERYAKLFEKPLVLVDLLATSDDISSYEAYLASMTSSFVTCLKQKHP